MRYFVLKLKKNNYEKTNYNGYVWSDSMCYSDNAIMECKLEDCCWSFDAYIGDIYSDMYKK